MNSIYGSNVYGGQTAQAYSVSSAYAVSERSYLLAQQENNIDSTEDLSGQSVEVALSDEARDKANLSQGSQNFITSQSSQNQSDYTTEEMRVLSALKSQDREVRAHELAHVAVGGTLIRQGASYQYELGPDGVRYAVSGEVSIDTNPVSDDPAATIRKMEQVKQAALAPAEPSSQDRAVAASASMQEAVARQELNQTTVEEAAV